MTNSEILKVLVRAKNLIAKGWCRGADARDENNRPIPPTDRRACKFCARGAVRRCIEPGMGHRESSVFNILLQSIEGEYYSLVTFNDSRRDRRPVLSAFRKAINKLKSNK
jgi:hypothetical protein